jgi:diguanylate cyclase (GGDEF)-like protein
VVAWTLVVNPFLQSNADLLSVLIVSAYAAGNVTIFGLGARLAFTPLAPAPAKRLVLGALAVMMVVDTWYGSMLVVTRGAAQDMLQDVGWLLWPALVAAAALHPSATDLGVRHAGPAYRLGRSRIALFVPLILLTPIVVVADHTMQRGGLGAWWATSLIPVLLSTALSVLLLARLHLVAGFAQRRAADLDAALRRQAALQGQLAFRALHDALTGLGNRTLLTDRLDAALHPAPDRAGPGAEHWLLLLDLDGFKDVNDSFGHPTGDDLLVAVAARLRAELGDDDGDDPDATVARLGGDEFAVVLRGSGQAAHDVGARLLAALRVPYLIGGRELYLTASCGKRPLAPPLTAMEALRDADLALYAAKAAGKNQIMEYAPAMGAARLRQSQLTEQLRQAIGGPELEVHYQPVVELRGGAVPVVEALVRWTRCDGTAIRPDEFIPIAEETGLIHTLGAWILTEACRTARIWYARHGTAVSVNISGRQLCDDAFAQQVIDTLTATGLPGRALILEITETVLITDGGPVCDVVHRLEELRRYGVRIAVDDFGTGYSSLAYVQHLPIDILKIDRAFVQSLGGTPVGGTTSARTQAVARAVLELGRGLELRTIAEGVETAEQAAALEALGGSWAQGYYFEQPVPAVDLDILLGSGRLSAGRLDSRRPAADVVIPAR